MISIKQLPSLPFCVPFGVVEVVLDCFLAVYSQFTWQELLAFSLYMLYTPISKKVDLVQ